MLRVVLIRIISLAVCLSLSNSVLLLGQLVAWSNMAGDRMQEEGVASAVLSTLQGEDLCVVCLFVREESRKQGESGTVKESAGIAKLLCLPDGEELFSISTRVPSYEARTILDTSIPRGRRGDVAVPPPRFEAIG